MNIPIEIVIDASDTACAQSNAHAAYVAGADRIEVCADMHVEGLTPSVEAIRAARTAFNHRPGVMMMLRPRDGEFCYNAHELDQIHEQIALAVDSGANGIVIGALTAGHISIDASATRKLVTQAHARGLTVTFHRAIDAVRDLPAAVKILADAGIDRVLTSGIEWGRKGTALDGIERLRELAVLAQGRFELVLAGGMSASLAPRVLEQLPREGRYSIHAYTSVLKDGSTNPARVRELIQAVRGA